MWLLGLEIAVPLARPYSVCVCVLVGYMWLVYTGRCEWVSSSEWYWAAAGKYSIAGSVLYTGHSVGTEVLDWGGGGQGGVSTSWWSYSHVIGWECFVYLDWLPICWVQLEITFRVNLEVVLTQITHICHIITGSGEKHSSKHCVVLVA